MISGIYVIKNKINNKVYIGHSENIKGRWKGHIERLNNNTHGNKHLLGAWLKYGKDNFEFIIIEECSENRFKREQYWIKYYESYNPDFGYNKTMGGEKGKENFTDETIEKIRKKAAYWEGKKFSQQHIENIRKLHLGKKRSEETKRKIGENWKGKKHTEEAIKKMQEAKLGKPFSNDGKLNISLTALKKLNLTEEQLIEIYVRANNGEKQLELSKEFNINQRCVSNIKTKGIFKLIIEKHIKKE